MSELSKYIKLKNNVEAAQQKRDRAEGALGQVLKRLKTEFGCTVLAQAEKKLTTITEQAAKSTKVLDKRLAKFNEEFEDELE